jgi:hypothetical protein
MNGEMINEYITLPTDHIILVVHARVMVMVGCSLLGWLFIDVLSFNCMSLSMSDEHIILTLPSHIHNHTYHGHTVEYNGSGNATKWRNIIINM